MINTNLRYITNDIFPGHTENKASVISSETTPEIRMAPPNCSSTPFRTPRSVRHGRRTNPLIGSPALPNDVDNEDRILGTFLLLGSKHFGSDPKGDRGPPLIEILIGGYLIPV